MAWTRSPWQNHRQWLTAEVNCESWFRPSLCSWKYKNSYLFYDHHVYIVLMKLKFWKGVCTCSLYWILLYCILCHVKIKIIQARVSQFWYAIILFHEIKKSRASGRFFEQTRVTVFQDSPVYMWWFQWLYPQIFTLLKREKLMTQGNLLNLKENHYQNL